MSDSASAAGSKAKRKPRTSRYPEFNCRPHVEVAPSLLSADFSNLAQALKQVERARCKWVHLDVMDGHFVPNLTFGPPVVRAMRKVSKTLFFDTHLMVTNPLELVDEFAEAGSNLITIHVESVGEQKLESAIRAVRRRGVQVGVTLRPKTPLKAIASVLGKVDLVLVMSVEPGFGGQSLIPSTLNKVRQLALLKKEHHYPYHIEIDGGVNRETAPLATAAGAE
ncbi:MAG: ribulose-phosphate 3-epimerase, partial [bacterium]